MFFCRPIGFLFASRLAFLLALFPVAPASAQDSCREALERAEDQYDAGQYQQVIAVLRPCLPNQVPAAGQLRAYKLLALAYLLAEDKNKGAAKTQVREMLKLNPRFEADITQDPQAFVDLVNEVRAEMGRRSKKWLWIGGGGVIAAAVAAFLIFKQEESDLPDPPLPP